MLLLKKTSHIICFSLILVLIYGCVSTESRPSVEPNQTYVTKTNIWYDENNIFNVKNYHHGKMIPVGTEVSVLETRNHTIRFRINADNSEFTLVRIKRDSLLTLKGIFERYFEAKEAFNVRKKQKNFSILETNNIEKGILQLGMSKDAAVMAYGYPPSLYTPTVKSNLWRYWVAPEEAYTEVLFRNNKIASIKRVSPSGETTNISATNLNISLTEFKNVSEVAQYNWLSIGIPELASTFLSKMKGFSLVERTALKKFLDERELELSGLVFDSGLSEVKSLLGAEYIILGSYRTNQNNINVNARMVKTETGEVLRAESVAGKIEQINTLVQELTLRMAGALGHKLTAQERSQIEQEGINMLKTLKAISQGELLYEAGEFDQARAFYKEALQDSPANPELLERIKNIDVKLNAIAVVTFENNTGQPRYGYLSNAIPEALSTALIKKTGLPLAERLNLEKALKEIEIGMTGIISPNTAVSVGKIAGATQLVSGSFQVQDTNLTIYAKIMETAKGVDVASETVTGNINTISTLSNMLVDKLVGTLKRVRGEKEAETMIAGVEDSIAKGSQKIDLVLEESMVEFDSNSATLKPSSYSVLNMLSEVLLRFPDYRILIKGHTDAKGTKEYNERLSSSRAKSVLQYMIGRGVPLHRLSSIGFGETRPRADNATEAGRAKNRRVEYELVKK